MIKQVENDHYDLRADQCTGEKEMMGVMIRLTPMLERKDITCQKALNATRRLPNEAVSHGKNLPSFLFDGIFALVWSVKYLVYQEESVL